MFLLVSMMAGAQEFFNLTAAEVRIGTELPVFSYTRELGADYADSVYTVSIDYPEFIDMGEADIVRYHALTSDSLPELPAVRQHIGVSRKRGTLFVEFTPLVFRNGRYQKLVSFMLKIEATPAAKARTAGKAAAAADRYAAASVLASGQWAKIRVPKTGIYQLTEGLIRQAGFTDLNRVRVFGYGGALQPELLTGDYLQQTDDLQEVPTCTVGGRRLFRAVGPVSWTSNTTMERTRNPYSDYGYYFLTQDDEAPLQQDSATFVGSFYPSADDYHDLYEVDDFAWYHGGRNLYDEQLFTQPRSYRLTSASATGRLQVVLSYNSAFKAQVQVNDSVVGTIEVSESQASSAITDYVHGATVSRAFTLRTLKPDNTVTISQLSGGELRLDYISLYMAEPRPVPALSTAAFDVPEYVHNITNQNLHADSAADMVIIISANQQLREQAERLKAFHESHDGLRVRLLPADELFNEFSSGTPDANAYRRYLKMLYDRATTESDLPRYLLMFGDGAWDNRMRSAVWRTTNPDDFLLCYESENSFSATDSYVTDDYFCMLDDGEGANLRSSDKADVAVGRFPARTEAEAKVMVDKTISYINNEHAGAWQNTLCFMGDDGNNNLHMRDADSIVRRVQALHPAFNIKKIYWDAYERQASATGFSYPDVTRLIRQQMQSGALIMNYSGHGAPYTLSHEQVVGLSDFAATTSLQLPLWVTLSCDIMPYDGQEDCIGETAVFNKNGGAVVFFGTTRTVYSNYNSALNQAFMQYVLGTDEHGVRHSVGEAVRLAKNYMITSGGDRTANKLQYALLGDPALTLASPTLRVALDSINGQPAGTANVALKAGQTVTLSGHIADAPDFSGTVTVIAKDVEETIVCRMNSEHDTTVPFTYQDRPNTLFSGTDSVRNGRFTMTFALPKDLSYSEGHGQLTFYAINNGKTLSAHGVDNSFTMTGEAADVSDGIGPSIYCYLNSPSFTNGGSVNPTPYFYAELTDKDGINASGSGIGHDLELIIDGELARTYSLNDYFQYEFGDYRQGHVGYSIPRLDYGDHHLLFRAWDVLNNSSVAELRFKVEKSLEPGEFTIDCTANPATTQTTFIITHDRADSELSVRLDLFDMSGRQLWQHTESGISMGNTYTLDWNLTLDGGSRLQTGVYVYRVMLSSDGSPWVSKAKKLIVLNNK